MRLRWRRLHRKDEGLLMVVAKVQSRCQIGLHQIDPGEGKKQRTRDETGPMRAGSANGHGEEHGERTPVTSAGVIDEIQADLSGA